MRTHSLNSGGKNFFGNFMSKNIIHYIVWRFLHSSAVFFMSENLILLVRCCCSNLIGDGKLFILDFSTSGLSTYTFPDLCYSVNRREY
jgi:hypothetical protein